ncbi:hypothetical protein RhiLY_02211 [Ceratobasidium sp. AG-Ba]|nr:hypothetical protein RhiLY_02211 [Ceratobasidium sp. AG-Ba]
MTDNAKPSTPDTILNFGSNKVLTVFLLIIITVVVTLLGIAMLLVRFYRRRRQQSTPGAIPQLNVLRRPESRRPSRRPSDFWSADVSRSDSGPGVSPRSPNRNVGLRGQEQVMQEMIGQGGSAIVAGSNQTRTLNHISLQIPTPTLQFWDRNTDVEQQLPRPEGRGCARPRTSESNTHFYIYGPYQHSARDLTGTVGSQLLLGLAGSNELVYSGSKLKHDTGLTSSSHITPSHFPPRHPSEPFVPDNFALGSPASPTLGQSPARLSIPPNTEPGSSLNRFQPSSRQYDLQSPQSNRHVPLPEPESVQQPEPALQPATFQTQTSLQRLYSRTTYPQRNTSSASIVASPRPRLHIVTDDMRRTTTFAAGSHMYASSESERSRLQRVVSEAISVESAYSTEHAPSRLDWESSDREGEGEMDGVRYSREQAQSSPALPDSVRTSSMSFFIKRN